MAGQRQPVDLWPKWLSCSCLGCATLAGMALVAAGVSVAIYARTEAVREKSAQVGGRATPLYKVDDVGVAVVRARGYSFYTGRLLPDVGLVACGRPVLGLGSMVAESLRNAGGAAEYLTSLMEERFVLVGSDYRAVEVLPPQSSDKIVEPRRWLLEPSGRRMALEVRLYGRTPEGQSSGEPLGCQMWVLDLSTRQWRQMGGTRVAESVRPLAWLAGGEELLCLVGASKREDDMLCRIQGDGTWANLCKLGGMPDLVRVNGTGKQAWIACWASGHQRAEGPSTLEKVDLATGARTVQPVKTLLGTHPGPLAPDESLIAVGRLGALDWRAARVRWITSESFAYYPYTAQACRDGRWAIGQVMDLGRSGASDGMTDNAVVAVSLADGRPRRIASGNLTLLDVEAGGRSILLSIHSGADVMPNPRQEYVAQVYLDWPAIERASPEPARLLGGRVPHADSGPPPTPPRRVPPPPERALPPRAES